MAAALALEVSASVAEEIDSLQVLLKDRKEAHERHVKELAELDGMVAKLNAEIAEANAAELAGAAALPLEAAASALAGPRSPMHRAVALQALLLAGAAETITATHDLATVDHEIYQDSGLYFGVSRATLVTVFAMIAIMLLATLWC